MQDVPNFSGCCISQLEEDELWNMLKEQLTPSASAEAPEETPIGATEPCVFCRGKEQIYKDGITSCTSCGAVLERRLDEGAEWRGVGCDGSGKDMSRCGLPVNILMPQSSYNITLTGSGRQCYLVRQYNMWTSTTYRERTLYHVFEAMSLRAHDKGLPPAIVDQAKKLYKSVSEGRIMRGDMRQALIAASVYMACKMHKVPRSAKEIANMFEISGALMNKGCKTIQQMLAIPVASTTAADLVARLTSSLNLGCSAGRQCVSIVACAEELAIDSESTPPTLAAGCVFLANVVNEWGVEKSRLSVISGVSASTITRCYNRLAVAKDVLFSYASGRDLRQASSPLDT